MKKIWIATIALLLTTASFSQGKGATTMQWDISFFSFTNYCTGENVRPLPGETIQAVLRLDETGSILHFINSANGHVEGWGVQTLGAYSMTVSMNVIPNIARRANVVNGNGAVQFSGRTQITSLDYPSSGVSRERFHVQVVLQDGVAKVVHLEPMNGVCAGNV